MEFDQKGATMPKSQRASEPLDELGLEMVGLVATEKGTAHKDLLDQFFVELRKHPLLTKDEFLYHLARWKKERSKSSFQRLITGNLRLVVSVSKKIFVKGSTLLDKVQEGFYGLVRALQKFEPERGFEFSTYATHWIRQAVRRAAVDFGETEPYRLPVHISELIYRLGTAETVFVAQNGYVPSAQDLYEFVQASTDERWQTLRRFKLRRIEKALQIRAHRAYSLDAKQETKDGEKNSDWLDAKASATDFSASDLVLGRSMLSGADGLASKILAKLDSLTHRERRIIYLRFSAELTLEECSKRFEVVRERIRQVEEIALRKLGDHVGLTNELVGQALFALANMDLIPAYGEPLQVATHDLPDADETFALLCEHVLETPTKARIVKAPLQVLYARMSIPHNQGAELLQTLKEKGQINGQSPWDVITIIPEVELPTFGAKPQRITATFEDFEELEDDGLEDDEPEFAEEAKASAPKPAVAKPVRQTQKRPYTAPSAPDPDNVLLEVYQILNGRSSQLTGEKIVRGALAILKVDTRFNGDALQTLIMLCESGAIEMLDGWRVVRLNRAPGKPDLKPVVKPLPTPAPHVALGDPLQRIVTEQVEQALALLATILKIE